MTNPYRSEKIEGWVSDFCGSPRFLDSRSVAREYAPEVLRAFLEAACAARDVEPEEIEEGDLKSALLDRIGKLEIPASVREGIPGVCGDFLEDLEAQGRLGGGRVLGLYVRALKEAYLEAASGKTKPIVAPAEKIGRNDPCPCGSGLKYKKCCMGRLGE
jgi:hypothetical protein